MGGVQTHVTVVMLKFFAMSNVALRIRPPNCSHLVQNRDLLSFLILRNDTECSYHKINQLQLSQIMYDVE